MKKVESVMNEFLSHCKYEKNLSPKTLKAYSIDLSQLLIFLNKNNYSIYIDGTDKHILREYVKSISRFTPKTMKRKIATLKALFNFLEFEDIILINPFRKMRIKIKEAKILPTVMTITEIKKILNIAYQDKNAAPHPESYKYSESTRNIAVLELLFATGFRVSELSSLKEENIDLQSGYFKVNGKGSKERIIQICDPETKQILNEYYTLFRSKIGLSNGFFFINRFNKRLSEQSVRFMVKNYAKRAGLEKRITPHTFRHSFATLLLEEDVDIKYIQHFLGHSSITTTQIYTHVNKEQQSKILLNKHPRKNFRMRED